MTEKRFKYKVTDGFFDEDRLISIKEVVDLLNEQQATITAQKKGLDEYMDNIIALSKENEQLGKNFEDLVEWVSGIAKRNVVLDEQIGELQRENKRLRKELGDCEKFRYTVFKRLNDEHIKRGSL